MPTNATHKKQNAATMVAAFLIYSTQALVRPDHSMCYRTQISIFCFEEIISCTRTSCWVTSHIKTKSNSQLDVGNVFNLTTSYTESATLLDNKRSSNYSLKSFTSTVNTPLRNVGDVSFCVLAGSTDNNPAIITEISLLCYHPCTGSTVWKFNYDAI